MMSAQISSPPNRLLVIFVVGWFHRRRCGCGAHPAWILRWVVDRPPVTGRHGWRRTEAHWWPHSRRHHSGWWRHPRRVHSAPWWAANRQRRRGRWPPHWPTRSHHVRRHHPHHPHRRAEHRRRRKVRHARRCLLQLFAAFFRRIDVEEVWRLW